MSNVGDALSTGSTDGTGISDSTFSDASLGDQITGGDGSFGTGDASAFGAGSGPSEFSQASDLATALSPGGAGGSSIGAQAASMTPPATAAATGGDPTGAASGTQSNTAPGSTPDQNQQQQGGGKQNQQNPDYAPPQAVSQLKALLKQLNTGKPAGPTGPTPQGGQAAPFALPTLAAGQTGRQSPQASGWFPNEGGIATLPGMAAGQTGPQSPLAAVAGSSPAEASIPPGAAAQPTRSLPNQGDAAGTPTVDADGNPITAAGTRADQTPLPPSRPGDQTADAGGGGRDITVKKPGDGGISPRRGDADLPTVVPPGSAAHPLPTHKPGASPAPAGPATSSILNDISGVSTGSPTALADLAQAAQTLLPIVLPLLGGLMGGGRRRGFGRFTGGRFMHGFGGGHGGFGHLHGGQHPAGRGAWPYHHPQFGWHMLGRPPGPGWRPLHPSDAQGIVGGGQGGGGQGGQDPSQDPNAPDPNNPPQEKTTGQPDDAFQKSGFSSNPFVDALVKQESGGGQNIVSKTDKDSQGRTLAQGGNPDEISQGYFQIQNHPGGTWQTYGRQAGIDLNKYPTPRKAPLDVQWQVAQKIPIGQWGPATKAILRQKFGNFDPNMPFGQVAAQYGPAGGRLAAQTPSRKQPAWAQSAPPVAAIPNTVPVTSQPMVAGGP